MIEYNEYGDAEGCTHNLGPHDMDPQEAWEARRVIHQATDSLLNWGLAMHKEVGVRQAALTDALQDVANLQQSVRVAHAFIDWVVKISEAGPRVELEYLKTRAHRAKLGHERTESHPPRPGGYSVG